MAFQLGTIRLNRGLIMYPTPYSIENFTGLIIFEISGSDYCLNNMIVSSILKPPFKLNTGNTPVKSKFSYLHGENSAIPLIDMEKIFTSAEHRINSSSRIIVVDYNDEQFGLLVGRIKEIVALDSKFITTSIQFNPKPEIPNGGSGICYVDGTLEFEGRKLMLPNLEKIIKETGSL